MKNKLDNMVVLFPVLSVADGSDRRGRPGGHYSP